MKELIRKILRETAEESTLKDEIWDLVKDVGKFSLKYNPVTQLLKLIGGTTPTKARLIFPKEGWETSAVRALEIMGIITGVYTKLDQANKFFKQVKDSGIILEEVLIGSHGSPGNLLITQKGGKKIIDRIWVDPDELWKSTRGKEGKAGYWVKTGKVLHESGMRYRFRTDFLEHIKAVVNSETKVYFTACHGADKLTMLKDAADYLGCECYACMGTNAFSFGCEDSNWSCVPSDTLSFDMRPSSDERAVMTGGKKYWSKDDLYGLKAYDKHVADFYEDLEICQQQPNVPFNWITLFG